MRIITTYEGSGLAGVPGDVARLCKGAKVDRIGLAIRGSPGKERKIESRKMAVSQD